jgi:Spy/CpxP family protein refolding chaperone
MDKRLIVLGIAACMFLSGTAYSMPEGGGLQEQGVKEMQEKGQRYKAWKQRHEDFIKELGLTQEQQDKLDALRKAHREENKDLREALKEKRQALKKELAKPVSDNNAISAIATEMKDIQAQLIDNRINNILQVKEVMTPEQYQKFQQKCESAKEKFGSRKKYKRSKHHRF